MRGNRVNGYGAVVLSLALLLPAASALGQVIDRNFTITDSGEPDTTATVNHTGASNSGSGQTICRNGSNTVTVSGVTAHPEFVQLVKNTARMMQGGLVNRPTLRVIGAGAQIFNVVLICEAAQFKSLVNAAASVNAGQFLVQGKNCTGLSETQATYLSDTCTADVDNQTLKYIIDGSLIRKLNLIGKGSLR